jgi:hypothetical protein
MYGSDGRSSGLAPRADGALPHLELQQSLEDLRGVRGARVEVEGPRVTAVRVLVVPERDTDETIEDVRTLTVRILHVDIDPNAVEVLRAAEPIDAPGARRRLSSISIERSDGRFRARVGLELGGDVLVGESDSPTERSFEQRSVAHATLLGLRKLLTEEIDLSSVRVLAAGDSRLAVVTLGREEETLVGSALVRLDEYDAIARATLDAVNRTIDAPSTRRDFIRLAP